MNSLAQKLIQIAESEVGYLEKASNSQLDDKTANAGKANWTKCGAWYGQGKNGYAWCAMFVSWCASTTGISTDIIPKYHSSTAGMNWFKQRGQFDKKPKPGDIIFFGSGSTAQHTGIVRAVDASRVYTVEGNTSGGSTLIANGGGVAKKSYQLSYSKILGYGHPDYQEDFDMYIEQIAKKAGVSESVVVDALAEYVKFRNTKEDEWEDQAVQDIRAAGLISSDHPGNAPVFWGEFATVAKRLKD